MDTQRLAEVSDLLRRASVILSPGSSNAVTNNPDRILQQTSPLSGGKFYARLYIFYSAVLTKNYYIYYINDVFLFTDSSVVMPSTSHFSRGI